jgi:hypothetical protein
VTSSQTAGIHPEKFTLYINILSVLQHPNKKAHNLKTSRSNTKPINKKVVNPLLKTYTFNRHFSAHKNEIAKREENSKGCPIGIDLSAAGL